MRPYTDDRRIHYVSTGENLGPAANWTRLIRAGSAPYVTVSRMTTGGIRTSWPAAWNSSSAHLLRLRLLGYTRDGSRRPGGRCGANPFTGDQGRVRGAVRRRLRPPEVLFEHVPAPARWNSHSRNLQRRRDVASLSAGGGWSVLRRKLPVPLLGRGALPAMALRSRPASWPSGMQRSGFTTPASPAKRAPMASCGSDGTSTTANGSGECCPGSSCRGSSTSCARRPTSWRRSTRSSGEPPPERPVSGQRGQGLPCIAPQSARGGGRDRPAARQSRRPRAGSGTRRSPPRRVGVRIGRDRGRRAHGFAPQDRP